MSERQSLSVTQVVAESKATEFGPDKVPFQEFVKIESLLKSGVTVDQIITLGASGNLPLLSSPETQIALVRLVEDKGFRAIVRQVRSHFSKQIHTRSIDKQLYIRVMLEYVLNI